MWGIVGIEGIMEASDSFLGDRIHIVKLAMDIIHLSSSQVLLINTVKGYGAILLTDYAVM